MDEKTYKIIGKEVRRAGVYGSACKDLVQDVCVRLLEKRINHVTRSYIRKLVRNMRMDNYRKEFKQPSIIFNNKDYPDEL